MQLLGAPCCSLGPECSETPAGKQVGPQTAQESLLCREVTGRSVSSVHFILLLTTATAEYSPLVNSRNLEVSEIETPSSMVTLDPSLSFSLSASLSTLSLSASLYLPPSFPPPTSRSPFLSPIPPLLTPLSLSFSTDYQTPSLPRPVHLSQYTPYWAHSFLWGPPFTSSSCLVLLAPFCQTRL